MKGKYIVDAKVSKADKIHIAEHLNLFNGVTMTIGTIIGTGIFLTPKIVLQYSGSIGMSLVVWTLCGLFSILGAGVYLELGTCIPKSGTDFIYLKTAYGDLIAFMYVWVNLVIQSSANKAIASLTFAHYILEPIFADCISPPYITNIVAALAVLLLTFINFYNVRCATRVQDIFTVSKVLALLLIIITGIARLIMGSTKNFQHPFAGTTNEPGYFVLSFYSGIYTYSGWNALNSVTEEVKDPAKNLFKAVCISVPSVIIIYMLTNIAYFTVLTPFEMLTSNAVAVTYADRLLSGFSWVMSISVAISTFGSLNSAIFRTARLFFAASKEGQLPTCFSLVSVSYLSPAASIVFLCFLDLAYTFTQDVYVLLTYVVFADSVFAIMTVSSLFWLRYKQPEIKRSFKVNLFVAAIYFVICLCLAIIPCYVNPWETIISVIIILSAIPIYYATIFWENKPQFYIHCIKKFTHMVQLLTVSVPEEKKEL